jgi:hypothetical protein
LSYTRRGLLASAAAFAAQLSVARAAEPVKRPTAAPEVWARTELYFGTNRTNGLPVTDPEFNGFVEQVISLHFPDGLTHLTGDGQFRSSTGELIRERSHVVILLYPPQMRDANQRIQAIRQSYKDQFGQESVLRVDSFSFVSF